MIDLVKAFDTDRVVHWSAVARHCSLASITEDECTGVDVTLGLDDRRDRIAHDVRIRFDHILLHVLLLYA